MRVSLSKSDRSFSVAPERPVLEAALAAGLALPYGCRGGNCGACRARLLKGEVSYPNGRPLGLSDADVREGYILLCQACAVSDLAIEVIDMSTPEQAVVKRLPVRIERLQPLSHDVLGVFLRLPAAESFTFEAGQYVDILLPGGRRRSFSIASAPHRSRPLELHIRRVAGGEFTEALFAADSQGRLLSIEGPLGRFVYRPPQEQPPAPLLLVGGGTGLAPLKSIFTHVLENGLQRDMTLYWGVRSERDLYAHRELQELARTAPTFRYRAVLSEPSSAWQGKRGWVHEAVLRDIERLAGTDIYASGPPAMIAALRREFELHGADPARLFFESFDYPLERQRTRAETKS
ncbi:MAG: 2Fe-2S iron-sulfur cluster-binding protein [Pseudomonadota bacterium]|nr:2Fe-2S iron-sulfur cluster-binding protein [Pseudomonadota bacterium]